MLTIEPARVADDRLEQLRDRLVWLRITDKAANSVADSQYEASMRWAEHQDIEAALVEIADLEARRLTVARTASLADRVALGTLRDELKLATNQLNAAHAASLERQEADGKATGFRGDAVRRDPATGQADHPIEHLELFEWHVGRALYEVLETQKTVEGVAKNIQNPNVDWLEMTLKSVAKELVLAGEYGAQLERWAAQSTGHQHRFMLEHLQSSLKSHAKISSAVTRLLVKTRAAAERSAKQVRSKWA